MTEHKLHKALVIFTNICPQITFDSVNPHYKSKYASLSQINKTINPALVKANLKITHETFMENDKFFMKTTISCEDEEKSTIRPIIPSKNDMQGYLAAETYAKRGNICNLLNLAADEDNDGESTIPQQNKPIEAPKVQTYDKNNPAHKSVLAGILKRFNIDIQAQKENVIEINNTLHGSKLEDVEAKVKELIGL